jgi:hypothetical protein
MATENPRVATYLTKENHEALQDFCTLNGIKSLSAGIDRILTEFFGRLPEDPRSTPPTASNTPSEVVDRIATLESQMSQKLVELEERLGKLSA